MSEDFQHNKKNSKFIIVLNFVDFFSLSVALCSGLAVMVALSGHIHLAIMLCFVAMLADAFDGILARKYHLERSFGRYLDSFMDVLGYLVAPALIWVKSGFNGWYSLCLLLMIMSGCVRLSVFNEVGNIAREESEKEDLSYLGMPVFWSVFILAGSNLLGQFFEEVITNTLTAIALCLFSYAMIYRKLFYKVQKISHILFLTMSGIITFLLLHIYNH